MTLHPATVTVTRIQDCNVIDMIWTKNAAPRDVRDAFQEISSILSETDTPVCVIVDLVSNPHFPLLDTLYGAIGPYRHRMLQTWLVISPNQTARLIEQTLSKISGRCNVIWFETRDDAMRYLADAADSHFE